MLFKKQELQEKKNRSQNSEAKIIMELANLEVDKA